jgi:hypothetical protein
LPAKLIGVALASIMLARWKPKALAVPAAGLFLVAAWHISGLLTNH